MVVWHEQRAAARQVFDIEAHERVVEAEQVERDVMQIAVIDLHTEVFLEDDAELLQRRGFELHRV